MNVWPDGGIGPMHEHPFFGKCSHCPAASGASQMIVEFIVMMIIPLSLLGLLWLLAERVVKP